MPRIPLVRRAFTPVATALMATAGFVTAGGAAASAGPARSVYTLSNASAAHGGNAVLAFRETGAGPLTAIGSFATGGNGNDGGLGSQGAVVLGRDDHVLAAVNVASDSVSLFAVRGDGRLQLLDTAASGGHGPISLSIDDHVLYVLNAATSSIAGFRIDGHQLRPIAGSIQALSSGASGPAEVAFTPDGRHLVVTEKSSNSIDTFTVDHRGVAGPAVTQPSSGATPFGFAFGRGGYAVVSDAAGGAPGGAAVSSYAVTDDGVENVSQVGDTQTAACWIAVTPDGRHAYTTNAGSGTVSSYDVGAGGVLTLTSAVATTITGHPSDEAVGGRTLYVLENAGRRITAAGISGDGGLGVSADVVTGLPASAVGIAVTGG